MNSNLKQFQLKKSESIKLMGGGDCVRTTRRTEVEGKNFPDAIDKCPDEEEFKIAD